MKKRSDFYDRIFQAILFGAGIVISQVISLSLWFGIPLAAFISISPKIILKLQIKVENRKMMDDIEHLFHLLHLQKEAGAFIMDSLTDCYRVVVYWKLKKALIDLAAAIHNKMPVRQATEIFAGKFQNTYLNTLSDIICHSVEDGNMDNLFRDVAEQITNLQQSQYVIEEGKQEAESILLFTLLFLGIVFGILLLGMEAIKNNVGILL